MNSYYTQNKVRCRDRWCSAYLQGMAKPTGGNLRNKVGTFCNSLRLLASARAILGSQFHIERTQGPHFLGSPTFYDNGSFNNPSQQRGDRGSCNNQVDKGGGGVQQPRSARRRGGVQQCNPGQQEGGSMQ